MEAKSTEQDDFFSLPPHNDAVPRSKSIFHLSGTDNEEEVGQPSLGFNESPDGSWSDHSPFDAWEKETNKDALRKFHALKELLTTEVGYLMDLKAFVMIYLCNLPTLGLRSSSNPTFGRTPSSFSSGPWINSYTQVQTVSLISSLYQPDATGASSLVSAKDVTKFNNPRYLFTDTEIECLSRNAEEILQLHQHFVRELSEILEPLGFFLEQGVVERKQEGPGDVSNLNAAIRAVSAKFATEASRFKAYQSFCAGHPEAVDAVRKVSQQHSLEWDAFEQQCATMVAELFEEADPTALEPSSLLDSSPGSAEDRKRTMSLTSLDGAVRSLRPRGGILTRDSLPFPTSAESRRYKPMRRIAFMDYLIKPVQRICKYPMLLDQLRSGKAVQSLSLKHPEGTSDVDVVVESAAQAMRHVATSVDEARHRQGVAIQSSLILSRLVLNTSATPSSNQSSLQSLTPGFLSSLGNCLLAGSLDVMHHHPSKPLGDTSNIKAKYLGAFLYPGGFMILVKVSKGRKYEPRHWFSLTPFDLDEADAMLPCSFRLTSDEQHFVLAAACRREKDAWLSGIREALTHSPAWVDEPTPSYKVDDKGGLIALESEDGLNQAFPGLPTIPSMVEVSNNNSDTELSEPFFASLRGNPKRKKKLRRPDTAQKADSQPPPSRRSSSTSVKAIFSPMVSDSETILIRRSSAVARLQVDQGLQDVISQTCLSARTYAFSHEEELFQVPLRSGLPRSSSGMSVAGMAKNRLYKHESVRVPRRRTTDGLESLVLKSGPPIKGDINCQRNPKSLKIATITAKECDSSSYPSPPSQLSESSSAASAATSASLLTPSTPGAAEGSPLKSSRFLVRGVKDLFNFRPIPSTTTNHSSQSLAHTESNYSPGMIQRWTKDSRKRARSTSDVVDQQTVHIIPCSTSDI